MRKSGLRGVNGGKQTDRKSRSEFNLVFQKLAIFLLARPISFSLIPYVVAAIYSTPLKVLFGGSGGIAAVKATSARPPRMLRRDCSSIGTQDCLEAELFRLWSDWRPRHF